MTRVLVTGASGLLGANLVLGLMEKHEVTAVTHTIRLAHPMVAAQQADLSAPGEARRLFRNARPDTVIHCAAATDLEACERDPSTAFRLNAEMAEAVARAASDAGAGLVHISTDAVFDGQGGPYGEDDAPAPLNIYAQSKLAGEAAVQRAHPDALVLRTNFFGWNARPKVNLAEWFLEMLRAGREAPGFTDVLFSPLLVNDMVELVEKLLASKANGILHLPGKDCLSKYEFGRLLAEAFELDIQKVTPTDSRRSGLAARRPSRTCLDGSRAASILGEALPPIGESVRKFHQLGLSGHPARLRALIAA
jgi:dTDP-4-dehydrorhamnose reductase